MRRVLTALTCLVPVVFLACSATLFAQAHLGSPGAPNETLFEGWLHQDAIYIISDTEKNTFQRLQTNEARGTFIQQFWLRRDPTPDTAFNEQRVEHYRRMIYANDQFGWSNVPGWKTDRGMVYIKFGAPDQRDRHPAGRDSRGFPVEKWRFRFIGGVGNDLTIEFTDTARNGEYRLTVDPAMKEAMAKAPGAALSLAALAEPLGDLPNAPIRYKELDAIFISTAKHSELPMQVELEYVPVTAATSLAKITIRFAIKDLQFKSQSGLSTAALEVRGRINSIGGGAETNFEDSVQVEEPTGVLPEVMNDFYIYRNELPLLIGRYSLNIAARDPISGKTTVYRTDVDVRTQP
jgi:GWxTD domain-containing protein